MTTSSGGEVFAVFPLPHPFFEVFMDDNRNYGGFYGRLKLFVPYDDVTSEDVVSRVNECLVWHNFNLFQENYLYWYRRGIQPILERKKEVRPEICNKVVINNAEFVTTFKNGYFLTDPVSYVSRGDDTEIINKYNEFIYNSGKAQADNITVDWFHTTGLGVEYLEPNDDEDVPVKVFALDPRSAFVVYSMAPGNKPVMGIHAVTSGNQVFVDAVTKTKRFRLTGYQMNQLPEMQTPPPLMVSQIVSEQPNLLEIIPFVEYQYNNVRESAFEAAMDLMNAINLAESNRLDGIEQAVQQLCVAYNCQFEEGTTANSIRQAGMIVLTSHGENKADFKILDSVLDQTATQTTIDNLYDQMLEKCGVPSSTRNAHSTSDNVGAVYLRSGWAAADTACRNTEDLYKESNRYFDKVFMKILKKKGLLDITPNKVKVNFNRNRMENLIAKTQAALNMKALGLAPEIWLERSGLSNDPQADIEKSMDTIFTMTDNSGNPTLSTDPENPEVPANETPVGQRTVRRDSVKNAGATPQKNPARTEQTRSPVIIETGVNG